jgi:hypothetical protein
MPKKYKLVILLMLVLGIHDAISQNNQFHKRGFFAGSSLGFQMGSIARFEAGPLAGFQFNEWFLAGLGARYVYYRDKRLNFNFTSHIYGGSLFSEFTVIQDLTRSLPFRIPGSVFLHIEYQLLSVPSDEFSDALSDTGDSRFLLPGYLFGAGWRQSAGKKSWIYILALYDFNDSFRFPYDNPLVRFGLVF